MILRLCSSSFKMRLLLFYVISSLSAVLGQDPITVCSSVKSGEPVQQLKANVPALGQSAGTYYEVQPATSNVTACILACCQSDDCHVSFLFNGLTCYKISCVDFASCKPTPSSEEKHVKSVFVWVREPKHKEAQTDSIKKSGYGRKCGDGLDPCPATLVCSTNTVDKSTSTCSCAKGSFYDEKSDECKMLAEDTSVHEDYQPKACHEGLKECGDNEKCKISAKKKRGKCVCISGYERDNATGLCENENSNSLVKVKSAPAKKELTIDILGPSSVQLPLDSVILFASPTGESAKVSNLSYYWEVLDGDGLVYVDSYAKANLTLTKLKPGTLTLQVSVYNDLYTGISQFKLKVMAEKKPNVKPKAMIRPQSPVQGTTGSQVVLDAEGSSDEDGQIASYSWQLLKGPSITLPAMNTGTLTLENLVAGHYTFALKVTDNQGAEDQASVEVDISEERDDPPKAAISRCGETATGSLNIRLPLPELYLCGNGSQDDKGIVGYNWFRIDDLSTQLPVDQTGSKTPVLKLINLPANEKLGPYKYKLEVTDSKGQKDETVFSIFVNKAENQKPVPDAGNNKTIELPNDSDVLDGNVEDDGSIEKYAWTQIRGPSQVVITNQDKLKATVTGLIEGVYQFRLNVTDDGGLAATDDVFLTVTRSKNEPPKAKADDVVVKLPMSVAILNGSKSTDDAGVVSYKWTPMEDVPACLTPLDGSDKKSVMMVNGLLPGEFSFNLTVADQSGVTNSVTVKLSVESGSVRNHSLELYLRQPAESFTYRLRNKLQQRLAAPLSSIANDHPVSVHFTEIGVDPTSGRLRIVFHALYKDGDAEQVVIGEHAVTVLRSEYSMLEEFKVDSIDTLYCFSSCSGHGTCSHFSKECVCDKFWMHNIFSAYVLRRKKDNCSWSVLYFTIILIMIISTVAGTLWMMLCTGDDRKNNDWCRGRTARRRKRYRLLDDSQSPPRIALKTGKGNGKLSSALLISTDSNASESEAEEILYSRDDATKRKPKNGLKI